MRKSLLILFIFCVFILTILISPAQAISVHVGEKAPDLSLPSIGGPIVSLGEFKGSVVVLIYFRSDQQRSILALKDIKDIHTKYKNKVVQFIGISAETEKRDSILSEMKELGIDFPVLMDYERDVYGSYGIRVYPSTVIIDGEGKVAAVMPGHALSYKIWLEGTLRYVLGEIDEEELKEIVSPEKKEIDEKTLLADRKYNLAMKFTELMLFDQAVEAVKQSIEAKPDMVKSHILLGYLYLDAGETDNAAGQFEKAVNIDPSSTDAMTGLGIVHIEHGETEKAIKVLEKALLHNPNPQRTLFELGRAYELIGNKEKAVSMYKQSIQEIIGGIVLPSSLALCR